MNFFLKFALKKSSQPILESHHQPPPLLYDAFPVPDLPLPNETFDRLMAAGYRLLGGEFIRHNSIPDDNGNWHAATHPLRIRLSEDMIFSKSQKKLLVRNAARLRCEIGRIRLTEEKLRLFERHATRFASDEDTPSVEVFIEQSSAELPVAGLEFDIFFEEKLVACSFAHAGGAAISGTYCIYDPDFGRFSLGNYTMLIEILYGARTGRQFYYPGYIYSVPSRLDYKMNFHGLERLEWASREWLSVGRNFRQ